MTTSNGFRVPTPLAGQHNRDRDPLRRLLGARVYNSMDAAHEYAKRARSWAGVTSARIYPRDIKADGLRLSVFVVVVRTECGA